MIYLGCIMFFRRKEYRLVLANWKILAFQFFPIIAVIETKRFDYFKRK